MTRPQLLINQESLITTETTSSSTSLSTTTTIASTTLHHKTTAKPEGSQTSSEDSKLDNILAALLQPGDTQDKLASVLNILGNENNSMNSGIPTKTETNSEFLETTASTTVSTANASSSSTLPSTNNCSPTECQCPSPLELICVPCDMDLNYTCKQIGNAFLY